MFGTGSCRWVDDNMTVIHGQALKGGVSYCVQRNWRRIAWNLKASDGCVELAPSWYTHDDRIGIADLIFVLRPDERVDLLRRPVFSSMKVTP